MDTEAARRREPAGHRKAQPLRAAARHPVSKDGHERVGLAGGSSRLTNVAWSPLDRMSFEQWVIDGSRLGSIGRGVGWWIGDWLRYGNARYGEKYVQAARITGYDVQTLMNMAYVASSVEASRRREKLSFSHHAEVAALPPGEQDLWMDRAEECRLSVADLRVALRAERKRDKDADEQDPEPTPASEMVCPQCGHSIPVALRRRRAGAPFAAAPAA